MRDIWSANHSLRHHFLRGVNVTFNSPMFMVKCSAAFSVKLVPSSSGAYLMSKSRTSRARVVRIFSKASGLPIQPYGPGIINTASQIMQKETKRTYQWKMERRRTSLLQAQDICTSARAKTDLHLGRSPHCVRWHIGGRRQSHCLEWKSRRSQFLREGSSAAAL